MTDIVYDIPLTSQEKERHTFSITVDNEFGVLARVISLFSGRGYNIESLTVAETNYAQNQSRITVVTTGTPKVIEQIKKLLERMVPVHHVHDLTSEGVHVERELALVKVIASDEKLAKAFKLAEDFRARVVNVTPESFIFEITSESAKVDAFIEAVRPLGLAEISRTGVTAMAPGLANA